MPITTKDISMLKSRIIWKVYFSWFFKRILPLLLVELVIIVLGLHFLAKYVFVEKVISHTLFLATANPLELFYYLLFSFAKTRLLTKATIIALLSFGVLILRDGGRLIGSFQLTSKVAKPNSEE